MAAYQKSCSTSSVTSASLANTSNAASHAFGTSLKTTKYRIIIRPAPSNYVWRLPRSSGISSSTPLLLPGALSKCSSNGKTDTNTIKKMPSINSIGQSTTDRPTCEKIPNRVLSVSQRRNRMNARPIKEHARSTPLFPRRDALQAVSTSSKPIFKPSQRAVINIRSAPNPDYLNKKSLTPPQSPAAMFLKPKINYNHCPIPIVVENKTSENNPMVNSPETEPSRTVNVNVRRAAQSVVGQSGVSLREKSSHVSDLVKQLRAKMEQKKPQRFVINPITR